MLKLIGLKRLVIVGALLGVNAFLAVFYFTVLNPMVEGVRNNIMMVTGEVGSLQGKIHSVKSDLHELQAFMPEYNRLRETGFFNEQNRFRMAQYLDELRKRSGLTGFSYNIADLETLNNDAAAGAGLSLKNSRINVTNVRGVTDIQFYRFVQMMQLHFPQHLRLHSFKIVRQSALTDGALLSIKNGEPVDLMQAEAVFDWLTLDLPKPQIVDPVTGLPVEGAVQ